MCGVSTTLPSVVSGCPGGRGSRSKTSRPAPAMRPAARASTRAASVDDRASRGVDQERGRLHQGDASRVEQAARGGRQGHVNRHDVRLAQQVVELAALGAGAGRRLVGQRTTPGGDAHPERVSEPRDVPADSAEAHDPEGLAVQHRSRRRRPRPPPEGGIAGRDLPHHRHRQTERELGRADRVPARRPGDEDAAVARRGEVDVARVVAGLHEDPHLGELLEQRAGEARPLAVGNQRIETAQRRRIAERLREDSLPRRARATGARPRCPPTPGECRRESRRA